jgi:hypothetical protein
LIERAKAGEDVYKLVGMDELRGSPQKESKEFNIKWVDSWRDIPAPDADKSMSGYYDHNTDTIYAIKGITTPADLEHEKYHSIKKHGDIPTNPEIFVSDEFEASKYAYDKIRTPRHILMILRATFNDLTINEYKLKPSEAMDIIHKQLLAINPPQEWLNDYKKLETEYHEGHQYYKDNPKSIYYGDIKEIGERPDNIPDHVEEKIPRRLTPKQEPLRRLEKTELSQYRSGRNKVYLVNMEYAKANPDIVQPANEIWLDNKLDIIDRKENLLQQLSERNRMDETAGQEYSGNIRELDSMIAEQLDVEPQYHNNGRKPREAREREPKKATRIKSETPSSDIASRYYLGRKLTEVDLVS